MDKEAFEFAKREAFRIGRGNGGIGTLSEKTLHATLKMYYCPNEEMHEIPIGDYVADIYNGDTIIEIQTRNLTKLREKLEYYLKEYAVKVVYPVEAKKRIVWVDKNTGELIRKRTSPVKLGIYEAFLEMFGIIDYLKIPGLTLDILLLEVEEYRADAGLNRRKRKISDKLDKVPCDVLGEYHIERYEDFYMFIPDTLEEQFYSLEFAKAAGISRKTAQGVLNFMTRLGILKRVGRDKRGYIYTTNDM